MQTLPHAAPHRHRNDQQGGQERTVSWRPWQPWQPQPRGVPPFTWRGGSFSWKGTCVRQQATSTTGRHSKRCVTRCH